MSPNSAVSHARPGQPSGWIHFRPSLPPSSAITPRRGPVPGRTGIPAATLDPLRAVFWQVYRHLFPPHALAAQTDDGGIVVSWSVQDDPHAVHPYAAPVLLRFDEQVIAAMRGCDVRQQRRIAEHHEAELRDGLRGYDPFARGCDPRVVRIG